MSKVFRIDPEEPSAEVINLAASVLREGGIVIFPTETVYGIGAAATSWCGPCELFDIKVRPLDKPLPWLVEGAEDLVRYGVQVPDYAKKLAEQFWPGGLTIVVDASDEVARDHRDERGTIALRAPDHEVVQELIRASGSPIAATSANTSGRPPAASYPDLEERIVAAADVVLDGGDSDVGVASTVVDCTGEAPQILREGPITQAEIDAALAAAVN
jgi:tRNA threonylcarbamoyl adenosine modification protein (Sua5/YciO/YrdC/YwlC family)